MELVGKGEVLWTETRTVNSQTLTDHFTSSREYVEHMVGVHQGPHLPPGDHVVPFTLVLPPNIPSQNIYIQSPYYNIKRETSTQLLCQLVSDTRGNRLTHVWSAFSLHCIK